MEPYSVTDAMKHSYIRHIHLEAAYIRLDPIPGFTSRMKKSQQTELLVLQPETSTDYTRTKSSRTTSISIVIISYRMIATDAVHSEHMNEEGPRCKYHRHNCIAHIVVLLGAEVMLSYWINCELSISFCASAKCRAV
jgi:hypothetical protein